MAGAGFYYEPTGSDRAICFHCGICLLFWEPTDEPWSEHERHSTCCPYVMGRFTDNVPLLISDATSHAQQHFSTQLISCWSSVHESNFWGTGSPDGVVTLWDLQHGFAPLRLLQVGQYDSNRADRHRVGWMESNYFVEITEQLSHPEVKLVISPPTTPASVPSPPPNLPELGGEVTAKPADASEKTPEKTADKTADSSDATLNASADKPAEIPDNPPGIPNTPAATEEKVLTSTPIVLGTSNLTVELTPAPNHIPEAANSSQEAAAETPKEDSGSNQTGTVFHLEYFVIILTNKCPKSYLKCQQDILKYIPNYSCPLVWHCSYYSRNIYLLTSPASASLTVSTSDLGPTVATPEKPLPVELTTFKGELTAICLAAIGEPDVLKVQLDHAKKPGTVKSSEEVYVESQVPTFLISAMVGSEKDENKILLQVSNNQPVQLKIIKHQSLINCSYFFSYTKFQSRWFLQTR